MSSSDDARAPAAQDVFDQVPAQLTSLQGCMNILGQDDRVQRLGRARLLQIFFSTESAAAVRAYELYMQQETGDDNFDLGAVSTSDLLRHQRAAHEYLIGFSDIGSGEAGTGTPNLPEIHSSD